MNSAAAADSAVVVPGSSCGDEAGGAQPTRQGLGPPERSDGMPPTDSTVLREQLQVRHQTMLHLSTALFCRAFTKASAMP